MKSIFAMLTAAALTLGSFTVVAPAPADAAQYSQSSKTYHSRNHRRHHHREVCRMVVKKKVVWRHHKRIVVKYKVRRCY